MILQKAEVRCIKCNHDFNIEMPVQCEIEIFTAAMKAVKCPECKAGSKYIALVKTSPVDE